MSGIDVPDNRPALAWVLNLPREWTTTSERLVLTVLAVDSYDGLVCSPNRDAILHATGLWGDGYYRALKGLTSSTAKRPPLLAVDRRNGARTVYTFLRTQSENPDAVTQSENPDAVGDVNPVGESRPGDAEEPSRRTQSENPVGEPSRRTQSENPDAHPSLPLPTLREGERKGEALAAPPPGGGALTRPTVAEVRGIIERTIPAVAAAGVDCSNTDLADALAQALAAGWDEHTMTSVLADMPAPKKSPTGQVLARVRDLAAKDPAAIIPTAADTTTTATADPLAEENQRAVAVFCKWSGADRGALSAALAEITAQGYTIDQSLAVDDYSQVHVDHPDLGDTWNVYWEVFQGVEYGEHVEHNELRARFDGLRLTEDERIRLLSVGRLEPWGSDGLWLTGGRPTVAALRAFVNVTGPIALAAAQRAAQAAPKPATGKATPMPPPVAEVLGDPPEPYRPGGPDAPRRVLRSKVRPPGFDRAVRDADAAERQRQQAALAALPAGTPDTDTEEDEW